MVKKSSIKEYTEKLEKEIKETLMRGSELSGLPELTGITSATTGVGLTTTVVTLDPMSVAATSGLSIVGHDHSDDRMKELIRELIYQVLEEESVLVHISKKVRPYQRKSIAISKLDPTIKDIRVEEDSKIDLDIMEELSKI